MAKKSSSKSDRSDPRNNKSLAIRLVLKKLPSAKASEVAEAVKKEYGLEISQNMNAATSEVASSRESVMGDVLRNGFSARSSPEATNKVSAASMLVRIFGDSNMQHRISSRPLRP